MTNVITNASTLNEIEAALAADATLAPEAIAVLQSRAKRTKAGTYKHRRALLAIELVESGNFTAKAVFNGAKKATPSNPAKAKAKPKASKAPTPAPVDVDDDVIAAAAATLKASGATGEEINEAVMRFVTLVTS